MSIDFEIPAEAKAIREKVRKWVHDECIPAEKELETKPLAEVLGPLRKKARAQGLWCPFVPKEYGGMGLGPLANALVQMELGESMLGALSMNTQGPDDASMMTILARSRMADPSALTSISAKGWPMEAWLKRPGRDTFWNESDRDGASVQMLIGALPT